MNNFTIDPRLVAICDEYVKNKKEYEFAMMLYAILDELDADVLKKVRYDRAAWKRKETYADRKSARKRVEAFFKGLSTEELIKFQNTPWSELPDWLKQDLPKLVMFPEENNFVRIYGMVNENERQKEITASRITRYMEKKRMITSDEEGTKLHYDRLAEICNKVAEDYDLPWRPGKKAQRTRITKRDLKNYTQCRVTPKHDKMAILSVATGLPLWYLAGYKNPNTPPTFGDNPLEAAPETKKFRKRRQKSGDAA